MAHLIIRTVKLAHCKRGPERCATCRETNTESICLLDIDPPDAGRVQRRVIEVLVGGESVWREYDVLRSFATEAEARAYAEEHGVEDVAV